MCDKETAASLWGFGTVAYWSGGHVKFTMASYGAADKPYQLIADCEHITFTRAAILQYFLTNLGLSNQEAYDIVWPIVTSSRIDDRRIKLNWMNYHTVAGWFEEFPVPQDYLDALVASTRT